MLFIWRSGKQTFGKKFLNVVEIGRVYIDQQCEIFGILSSCEEEDKGRFLSNPLISKQVKRSPYEEEVLIKWKCHTVLRLIEKFNVELNTNFFIQKYIFWHEEWLRLAEELTNTYAPRCYFIKWKIHLHYHIFFGQNSRLKLLRKLALIFMARNEWAVLEILITVMPTSYQNSETWNLSAFSAVEHVFSGKLLETYLRPCHTAMMKCFCENR